MYLQSWAVQTYCNHKDERLKFLLYSEHYDIKSLDLIYHLYPKSIVSNYFYDSVKNNLQLKYL